MPASMSRKVSAAFVFALLLGGNLVAFFPAMRASREIRRFCEELRPGTPLAEVRSRADELRYRVEPIAGGLLVEHSRSLGRAYCTLGFDGKGLLLSKACAN